MRLRYRLQHDLKLSDILRIPDSRHQSLYNNRMMSIFTRNSMFCEISRYELLPVSVPALGPLLTLAKKLLENTAVRDFKLFLLLSNPYLTTRYPDATGHGRRRYAASSTSEHRRGEL